MTMVKNNKPSVFMGIEWKLSLANMAWAAWLFGGSFALAWAAKVAGIFSAYAPFSYVAMFFTAMGAITLGRAVWALSSGKLERARYNRRLFTKSGEIDPIAMTFERKRIHLNDFILPSNPTLKGKSFTDCEIIGPANIYLLGDNVISEPQPPDSDGVIVSDSFNPLNAYVFKDCSFKRCSFQRCTFYMTSEHFMRSLQIPWINWVSLIPLTDEQQLLLTNRDEVSEPQPLLNIEEETPPKTSL